MTLQYLQSQLQIPPQLQPIPINSPLLDRTHLTSLKPTTLPVLLQLSNHSYYYGHISGQEATDPNAIFIFGDQAYYKGSMVKGKFEGKGKLTQLGKFEYEGEWKNGKPDGEGREVINSSIVYVGHFRDGKKNGNGKLQYQDGSCYVGEFKDNHIWGDGEYKTRAHQWNGNWQDGYLQGEGEQVSFGAEEGIGNSEYHGGFKRGVKNGVGQYNWGHDFSIYRGHFTEGQLDGQGFFKIGSTEYEGSWEKGMQVNLQPMNRIVLRRRSKAKAKTDE